MRSSLRRPALFLAAVALGAAASAVSVTAPLGAADDADSGVDVSVTTDDKLTIAGTRWSSSEGVAPGVVLLHMYRSDRTAWRPLVRHLRARGFEVLAIDLRGHGGSARQGKTDLAPRVEKRDAKLFQDMHKDAIAAVRFLVKEAACDPARVSLVGASVGCSVAIDTARRYPKEVAAVACLSPGANYLGLNTIEHAKSWPAGKPLLLLAHQGEADAGAASVRDAIAGSRLLTYEDAQPESAAGDPSWAHGTKMFGRIPLVEQTVASFVAARTGSKKDDVVLDGVVAADGADADPWTNAVEVGAGIRAYRVGKRVVFGGQVPDGSASLQIVFLNAKVRIQTPDGKDGETHLPTIAALDLAKGTAAWTYPSQQDVGRLPIKVAEFPPAFRVAKGASGTTIEGEWTCPSVSARPGITDPSALKCLVRFDATVPEPPSAENRLDVGAAVELKSR